MHQMNIATTYLEFHLKKQPLTGHNDPFLGNPFELPLFLPFHIRMFIYSELSGSKKSTLDTQRDATTTHTPH
jgi:hypothetical protein